MKKVVIIANQFPPIGGSGVQRSVKFVKHLRSFGYEPVVLTRETKTASLIDETLLNDVPKNTQIIRTKAYEPAELKGVFKIIGKIISKLLVPDSSIIWSLKSRKNLLDIMKSQKIDIVYTTSAPYSDHLLGLFIKRKLPHTKLVCDFRDEWTNNPYTLDNPHNIIRTKIEKKMEKKVLETADFLITNTPVMMQNFIENNKELDLSPKFFVIPNGYDKEDFKGLDTTPSKNSEFTMVYTGALYGRRKPDLFFKAIKNLIDKDEMDKDKIKVKLIGNYHKDKLQAKIDSLNLTGQIEIVGYVPHDICIKAQLSADALVLIEGGGVGANAFYTGKIFEYMNTNRPVIAILPDGVAKDLVIQANIGKVANTDKIDEIETVIKHYYQLWETGEISFSPNKDIIEKYERKKLTENLAQIFSKL